MWINVLLSLVTVYTTGVLEFKFLFLPCSNLLSLVLPAIQHTLEYLFNMYIYILHSSLIVLTTNLYLYYLCVPSNAVELFSYSPKSEWIMDNG